MGSGGGSPPDTDDPLEDMAASTVAVLILFGSLTFATVSMLTKTLLLGDKRAIVVATSIKLKSPFPEGTNSQGSDHTDIPAENSIDNNANMNTRQSVESIISGNSYKSGKREKSIRSNHPRSVTSSRSIAHARNTSANEGNTVSNIKLQETSFVQMFVLMYHMMLFGLILLGIYLIDRYPPNSGPREASKKNVAVLNEPFQFNADIFLSWMIVFVIYSCYISWQRNDGKIHTSVQPPQEDDTIDIQSTNQDESSLRQQPQSNLHAASRRDETSTISRGSTHSGFSKRLEDVMLEEVLGHDDHDTINDAFENAKQDDKGWFERGLDILGLKLGEDKEGVIREWNPVDDVLNPLQTLEWKGLFSVALLVYQYCSSGRGGTYMAKVDEDDEQNETFGLDSQVWSNLEKVGLSSFLFLTGYNHTSYYYYHQDNIQKSQTDHIPVCYGLSRVLGVLFRWNWTAFLLSLTLGNNLFEQYTVCLVHSGFFMAIWSMLRIYHSINYKKYKFRLKMFAFVCMIVGFDIMMAKLFRDSSSNGVFWEWRYLFHLQHLAPLCGAMFAINKPIASLQLRKFESYSFVTATLAKGSVCLALTVATIIWASGPLQSDLYDKTHAYFGIVPLLAYTYWRNLSHGWRSHHNSFLSWIGQYSLEIFLLSKHTVYYERVLVLVLGYPHLNFLLVAILVIFLARTLNNLTNILRQLIIPENNEQNSVVKVPTFIAGGLVLYLFAKLLCWAELVNVGSIITIVIIMGVLLYQIVMDMAWVEHQSRSNGRQSSVDMTESNSTKISVPISGIMSVFLLTTTWYGWVSLTGAANELDASCIDNVNKGFWLPINACDIRSGLKNSINYFGYKECEEDFIVGQEWVWSMQYIHCGFRYRNGNDIKSSLLHKRLTFIGDSSIRSLFYSLCRSMGDHDAGGYEGIASHSDLRRLFPAANIEYKFSPLSVDIVAKLKSMRTTGFSSGRARPDLLVAGGGTWDKLHMAATDEDQQSHREVVERLAFELDNIREQGIPVVWVIPPVVNTPALNSDEKRAQMSEKSLEEIRQMYRDLGVELSASFVLEGPSFTNERIADSFDGIDYPNDVYDAGIQILANAFDWLLEPSPTSADEPEMKPDVDISANPYLNSQVLIFAMIGLFFFDAYFGLSYLSQIFVRNDKVAPSDIYDDSFACIFIRSKPSHALDKVGSLIDDGHTSGRSSGRSVHSTTTSLSRRRY